MRQKISIPVSLIFLLSSLVLSGWLSSALAQSDDPSLVWVGKTAKKKPQQVTRVKKSWQKHPPAQKKPVVAPLLSLQWGLRTRGADGQVSSVSPQHVFTVKDPVQIFVKANQAGYLYIIQEDSRQESGYSMVFPYTLFNQGKNYVQKNVPLIIPSGCAAEQTDKNGNCYYEITPTGSGVTLIFSRTEIQGLPNEINRKQGVIPISRQYVDKLLGDEAHRNYSTKDLPQNNLVQYWNNNPADNETLVVDTKINYQK